MNEADALDIVQYAIWTVLVAAGPSVAVAMIVGIAIATALAFGGMLAGLHALTDLAASLLKA